MCGRLSIATGADILRVRFNVEMTEDLQPRYNAAPTQYLPVILNEEPRAINLCKWGLIPYWAREEKIGSRMINARAETLLEKMGAGSIAAIILIRLLQTRSSGLTAPL